MKRDKISDSLYLELDEPLLTRKNILETAIVSAKILKHYELFSLLRQKDTSIVQELNQSFEKLRNSFNLLTKAKLPAVKEIEQAIKHEERELEQEAERLLKQEIKDQVRLTKESPKKKLDREFMVKKSKLDLEIEEIEERLKRLGL